MSERKINWDVKKGDPIEYFDTSLSYEATGYIPINETSGLDFDPDWFRQAVLTYEREGHYTKSKYGTRAYRDFFREEYKRCKYGYTVNGYTITGHHYHFLNYYRLKDLVNVEEAGMGREEIPPEFLVGQYEWFHYLRLVQYLKLNGLMMKSREAGFSEIEASILSNNYSVIKNSVNVATAFSDYYLGKLLDKVWDNLTFKNDHTDGGFFKSRQAKDSDRLKRASQYKMVNGQKVEVGWKSQIQGIVSDTPDKIRGDRTDLIIFEEAGSFPRLTEAFTKADALVGQIYKQWGVRIIGGTGGDSGAKVYGLRTMYYSPRAYGILPYRHNYTETGEYVETAFFLPAFKVIKDKDLLDSRGFISRKDGEAYFQKIRDIKSESADSYTTYVAEYCFTAEEGFSLEGENNFNKENIASQLTEIRAFKRAPKLEKGYIEYIYRNNIHKPENISGYKWVDSANSHLKVLEHPLWTLSPRKGEDGNIEWTPPDSVLNNLYVIGVDGIDIGKSQTSAETKDPSDFCAVVYKRAYGMGEPQVVAIYKDRPNDVRDAYKMTIKLAEYYNAKINIEATRQSLIPYARDRGSLNYFMKRPSATLTEKAKTSNRGTRTYGTPATKEIIAHQVDLITDYINDYCHLIWFEELLDEARRYSDENKRNFDIIAAFGMALLADEELRGTDRIWEEKPKDAGWQDFGYYTDEYGRRRYGIIPTNNSVNISISFNRDDGYGIRTSDPRRYNSDL